MTTHVHLLIRTPDTNLRIGVKATHGEYATRVNHGREEHGHVFGRRFHNRLVGDDRHLLAALRYIAQNPVAAGICKRPADWRWSAHRALAGVSPAPPFLDIDGTFGLLHSDPDVARSSYLAVAEQSDHALLTALRDGCAGDEWLISAVDVYRFPVTAIADFLGRTPRTVFRRIACARGARAVTECH